MAFGLLKSLQSAYSNLNPEQVRQLAEKPLAIELVADTEEAYSYMEAYLLPAKTFAADRVTGLKTLHRTTNRNKPAAADITIYEQGIACPRGAFTFYADRPEQTVCDILDAHSELEVSLARQFLAFRQPAMHRIIARVAKENALFTLATAMPNIIPSFLELPWALGEYATDSAFLTVNQVRMAFLIAGASGRDIGLADQKAEILGIVASAFGWRGDRSGTGRQDPAGRRPDSESGYLLGRNLRRSAAPSSKPTSQATAFAATNTRNSTRSRSNAASWSPPSCCAPCVSRLPHKRFVILRFRDLNPEVIPFWH